MGLCTSVRFVFIGQAFTYSTRLVLQGHGGVVCGSHMELLCTKNAFRLHIYVSMKEKEKMQCFLFSLALHYLLKEKNLTLSSQQTLSPSTIKKEDTELEEFHVQQTKSRFCVSSLLDLSLSSTKRESPQLSERFLPQLADTLILPSSSRNACWLSQVLVSSHHFPLELLK